MSAITFDILTAAIEAAEGLHESECVHIHADGRVTTGTDGWTTTPQTWGDITHTFHPSRAADPWDCFEPVGEGE